MGYIYKIYNDINNLVYIGQTCKTIQERWNQHLHASQKLKNTNKLYTAMRELSLEKFHIIQLEECENQVLNQRENYWINYYNSIIFGYNTVNAPQTKWTPRNASFKPCFSDILINPIITKFTFSAPTQQEINLLKNKIVIYQWDEENNFIMSYDSIEMAAFINNISSFKIFQYINTRKLYQGYYWTTIK